MRLETKIVSVKLDFMLKSPKKKKKKEVRWKTRLKKEKNEKIPPCASISKS